MAAADKWLFHSQLEESGLWLNQATTYNTVAGELSEKSGFDGKNVTDSVTKKQGIFLMMKYYLRDQKSLVLTLGASP